MDISLNELRGLLVSNTQSHSLVVGKKYLIRTVTMHYVGRIASITDCDIVLEEASWVADTGRFHDCLETGNISELEPFIKPVIVSRSVIVDATEWSHVLPRKQK